MSRVSRATFAVCTMLCAAFAPSAPASTIWSQGWTTQTAPMFVTRLSLPPELRGVAFGTDGDVLVGSLSRSGTDEQVTRFGADGTLRWSANLQPYADAANIVAATDGGAYATFRESTSAQGYAARIDAAGQVIWGREVPAIWLAEVSTDRVAVADCSAVSMLDATQGAVLWQRTLFPGTYCVRGGLAIDSDSNVYAVADEYGQGTPQRTRVAKFSVGGDRIWERIVTTNGEAGILGVAGGRLYLRDEDSVTALDTANASVLWTARGEGQLLAGETREPIVFGDGALRRLRAVDGTTEWTTPLGTSANVSAVGEAIVAWSADSLSRVDVNSGAIQWTVPSPATIPQTIWATFGGLADGAFTAIGSSGSTLIAQRVDFASGAMLASIDAPPVTQGISGYSSRIGADVVSVAVMYGTEQQELRVRSVDGTSGSVRWDAVTPVQQDGGDIYMRANSFSARTAGGPESIVAAVPMNDGTGWELDEYGAVRVVARDRLSGAVMWNVVLNDSGEGYTSLADLVVDADENVFVAVGTTLPCDTIDFCWHQTIYKLAAADGSVVWRDDQEFGSAFAAGPADPPSISAIGRDVLAASSLYGSSSTVRRLAGTSGSELWHSDVFAAQGVASTYVVDATHVVAFGRTDGTSYAWSEIDGVTGATLWTNTQACSGRCSTYAGAVAPNGDLLFTASSQDSAPALARVHDDGGGDVDSWQVADTRADIRSYTYSVSVDDAGRIWLSVQRLGSWMGSGSWYGYFDAESGALLTSQTLPGGAFGAPAPDGTVLGGWGVLYGPSQEGVSLVDATLGASGNLAATLSIDRTHVMPNDSIGFDLAVTYEGDAPIAGARLTGRMPWASGATGLACAGTSVSNCTIEARSSDVRATFDIAPGGTVHVTGRIRVLDIDSEADPIRFIGVSARGPEALDEHDTIDNFARTSVVESLFLGGFDPD